MATQLQKLIAALRGGSPQPQQPPAQPMQPPQQPLPPQFGGMAGGAQDAMRMREYQMYVQEQQAQGLPAAPFKEYLQGAR